MATPLFQQYRREAVIHTLKVGGKNRHDNTCRLLKHHFLMETIVAFPPSSRKENDTRSPTDSPANCSSATEKAMVTGDLFAPSQPEASGRVMNVLDEINAKWGRGTLRTASVPVSPEWGMRIELKSPSYTTRLDELWTIGAGSSWSR